MSPGDRNVPWLSEVPKDWRFKPLKYLVKVNKKVLEEDTDPQLRFKYIDIGRVDSFGQVTEVEELDFADAPSRARRVVSSGDVLISTVRTYLRAITFCENVDDNLICSTGFAVLTPGPDIVPKYLFYWVRSSRFVDEIVSRSVGVSYPAVNAAEIGNLPFPLLTREKQNTLAAFLDRKTTGFDALISLKEHQIILLNKKRQLLINRAVTRGLNSATLLHSPGIERLNAIPDHWEAKRLKFYLHSIEQGWSPSCENRPAEEDEWGVLKVGCVNGNTFNANEQKALPPDTEPRLELEIQNGDVLMSRANTRELLGSPSIVEDVRPKLLLCDKLYRINVNNKYLDRKFLVYALRSSYLRYQIERDATGTSSSMQNIGQDTLKGLILAVPPLEEQHAIISYLDHETSHIDKLTQIIQIQIDKLRVQRQALISTAVTGKVDVKGEIV